MNVWGRISLLHLHRRRRHSRTFCTPLVSNVRVGSARFLRTRTTARPACMWMRKGKTVERHHEGGRDIEGLLFLGGRKTLETTGLLVKRKEDRSPFTLFREFACPKQETECRTRGKQRWSRDTQTRLQLAKRVLSGEHSPLLHANADGSTGRLSLPTKRTEKNTKQKTQKETDEDMTLMRLAPLQVARLSGFGAGRDISCTSARPHGKFRMSRRLRRQRQTLLFFFFLLLAPAGESPRSLSLSLFGQKETSPCLRLSRMWSKLLSSYMYVCQYRHAHPRTP